MFRAVFMGAILGLCLLNPLLADSYEVDGTLGFRLMDTLSGETDELLMAGNHYLDNPETDFQVYFMEVDPGAGLITVRGTMEAAIYSLFDFQGDAQPVSPERIMLTFEFNLYGDELYFSKDPVSGASADAIARPGAISDGFLLLEGGLIEGGAQIVPLEQAFLPMNSTTVSWRPWIEDGVSFSFIVGEGVPNGPYLFPGRVMTAWIASVGSVKMASGRSFSLKGDFNGSLIEIDDCGIREGDNSAKDRCGLCFGDGSSCCQTRNQTQTLTDLDSKAKRLSALVKNSATVVRNIGREQNKPNLVNLAKKSRREANLSHEEAWTFIWQNRKVVTQCNVVDNSCVTVSTGASLASYTLEVDNLNTLFKQLRKKIRKLGTSKQKSKNNRHNKKFKKVKAEIDTLTTSVLTDHSQCF